MGPKFEKIVCSSTMSTSETKVRLCQLEEILLERMPRSVQLLVICRIGIKGRYLKSNLIQFYKYRESENDTSLWHEDKQDPFIICVQRPNIITKKGVIMYAPETPTQEMLQAFESFIDWTTPQTFGSVPEHFSHSVLKLCKQYGTCSPSDGIPCHFLSILDVEKAKNLKLDEEFLRKNKLHLRELQENDLAETVKGWAHGQDHTEEELRQNIGNLYSSGLFTEEGEMVSSFMHSTMGLFSGLHTPEKFRRKGYGAILTTWLAKKVAQELGTTPISEAEPINVASKTLLEKVGFEEVQMTRWIFFKPQSAALP